MAKIRRVEHIPVSSFRVGDIYGYGEDSVRDFRIDRIRDVGSGKVAFHLVWIAGEWTDKPTRKIIRNLTDLRWRVLYADRACAPCYDSDCECVYDQVPDEYEE